MEDLSKGTLKYEKELAGLLYSSDIWSTDQYLTLHYGWPFHPCDPEHLDKHFKVSKRNEVWEQIQAVHQRFVQLTGRDLGIELGEFNTDGDVGGEDYQAERTEAFYRRVLKEKPSYLKGITMYQFRDRGRLGVERQDPNNETNGLPTAFLSRYRKLLQEPYFQPGETWTRSKGSLKMDWRYSDDSDGLGWKVSLKSRPSFLELLFDKKANLVIRAGKTWFYKKPGVETVDVTAAATSWGGSKPFPLVVFAPPAEGMNPKGSDHVPTRLSKPPKLRLLYKWKL